MRALTRRSLLLAGAGLGAGTVLGCAPAPPVEDDPTPAGPPTLNEPPLPRLTVRRLWSAPERLAITDIRSCTLVAGVLVATCDADDRDLSDTLAIDLVSGRVRWSARQARKAVEKATGGASLFDTSTVVAGSGAAAVVLGTTYLSPCPAGKKELCHVSETSRTAAMGVVALALEDGSVVWTSTVAPSVPRDDLDGADEDSAVVTAADATSVVVAVGSSLVINGSYVTTADRRCRTVVLEASTGRRRWVVEDLLPLTVVDDVVLTQLPSGPGPLVGFTEIVALDLATGRRRWSSRDRLEPAILRASTLGLAVLRTTRPGGLAGDQHLVDPRTGEPVGAPLPTSAGEVLLGTGADGATVAAWTETGQRGPVDSLTTADPEPRRSARSPFENTSLIGGRIHHGYVWCSELAQRGVCAVDRSGNRCSDPLSSFLVGAVDDDHLVVLHRGNRDGLDRKGFTAYALS